MRNVVLALLFLSLAGYAQPAVSEDLCSGPDVIEPALEQAGIDGACNVDGAYISASSLLDAAETECVALGAGPKCQKCFAERVGRAVSILRLLARDRLVSTSALAAFRDDVKALRDTAVCGAGTGNGNSGNSGDGDTKVPVATPPSDRPPGEKPPGEKPPVVPTNTPGTPAPGTPIPGERDTARAAVIAACPCDSFTSHDLFLKCGRDVLSSRVTSGTLSRDGAYALAGELEKTSCGGPRK